MGVSSCGRARALLLLAISSLAVFSGAHGTTARAQELEPARRWDGLVELISGSYWTAPPATEPQVPADGPSQVSRHAVSGDGRYVLFSANAPNLGYSAPALYLRDRSTNDTRVLLGGPVQDAVVSADGNHIAFTVCDPWMRPDLASICDVWSLDTRTWAWAALSTTPDGVHGDADSGEAVLSGSGRFVVFRTVASNLAGGPAGVAQLVVRDRDADGNGIFDEPGTATLETVSVSAGLQPGNGDSATAEVSDDGRFVAFRSLASNLVPADTNNVWDVFRRDRHSNETRRLNERALGEQSPDAVDSPAISMSADGQRVVFTSADGFLASGAVDDTNHAPDVFVFDAADPGPPIRLDIGDGWPVANGYVPGNGASRWPSISANGRYVAFESLATNVALPPPDGTAQVYVFDLGTGTATRISVKPDGSQPDASAVHPEISADGSVVTFVSPALNLARNVTTAEDRVYAAVHFSIGPAEVSVPGSGGSATFTVTTQQQTQWWVDWTDWSYWVGFDSPPLSVGSGELRLIVADENPGATPRSATIRIFDREVTLTQLAGLSVTSASPDAGPQSGGTQVTIRGTGFGPSARVVFDGYDATATEFVDATTLVATTPAHEPATVWIAVFMPDGRAAWIDQAFRYTDGTPPLIWPLVSGSVTADGWYTSDATVNFWLLDEHSAITSTSGCDTVVVTADTPGQTFSCTATSDGGTSTASVTVKRDTTGPSVVITTPAPILYERDSVVIPELTCTDALSGVATCGADLPPGGGVDTSSPGWHTLHAYGLDAAGNLGFSSVQYGVSTGVCAPTTAGLRLWFEFEGDGRDSVHGDVYGWLLPEPLPATYVPGRVGQALRLSGSQFFQFSALDTVKFRGSMTFAAWIKADGENGEAGVIASKEDQFRIARFADGTVRWAFTDGAAEFDWVNTGATIPAGAWTHLVVTYDHGSVNTYVNGRLAHAHAGSGSMLPADGLPDWSRWLSIGNRLDPSRPSFLVGAVDEVQLVEDVWDPWRVESSFFAGSHGMCRLAQTQLVATPATATFGSATYVARAQLRVAATGQPVAGRPVRVVSSVSGDGSFAGGATLTTDADGWIEWNAPMRPDAPANTYASGFSAFFDADYEYSGATAVASVVVDTATPALVWAAPASIAYGTPLSASQLNATANVAGVFTYSHPAGTILPAGQHTLTVSFDPDSDNYRGASASVTIEVRKASPVLTWTTPAPIVYGTALGAIQLNAAASVAGTWAYAPASGAVLSAGAGQTLTATFTPADTGNYQAGTIESTIDVLRAPLTVRANDASKRFGAPLPAFTATVTGFVHGDSLASLAGALTFSTTAVQHSPVGTYPIVPSGVSASNYTIAFIDGTLTIVRGLAAVAVATSPGTSGLDQPMTFTATVVAAEAAVGQPTGTVRFFDGAVLVGSATLSGRSASISTAGLDAGLRDVEARYDGDATFDAAAAFAPHVVRDADHTPVVTITSSRNPSNAGQTVTLTASAVMPAAAVLGIVEFHDGATLLGTAALVAGRATLSTSALPAGSHAITARYLGVGDVPPSRSGVFVQAVGAGGWKDRASTITLASAPDPAPLGTAVTVVAEVTGSWSSMPTGRVAFTVNGEVVGEVALSDVSGTTARATFTIPGLNHGRHDVAATYLGDVMYKGSSASVTQVIN